MNLWHWFGCRPGDVLGFDGASLTSRCRNCGAYILQDSSGAWFPVSGGGK